MTAAIESKRPSELGRRAHRCALRAVLVAWLVGGLVVQAALAAFGPSLFALSLGVWLASGLIAVMALAPGVLAAKSRKPSADATEFLLYIFVSMGIRLVGTVALFLLCRYHGASSAETAALFVCSWYVLLTGVEVATLANAMPRSTFPDQPNAEDMSVVPSGSSQSSVTE